MQRNIIRLLIFLLTLLVGLGVYFVSVSNSIQEIPSQANDTSFSSEPSTSQEKPSETDFYNVASCTEANQFKEYKYPLKSHTVARGFLNGLVLCGTVPKYFPTTKNAETSGIIKVEVFADEAGEVIEAHAATNNFLLRQQVEKAVRQTRFYTTLLGGEFMKINGTLVYQFDSERGYWLPKRFSENKLYPINH